MKYKTVTYFSMVLFLLIPANAFGDSVNISADLPIFTDADKIVIYGNVVTETTLQVMITDPDEIIILNKDIMTPSGAVSYTHLTLQTNREV